MSLPLVLQSQSPLEESQWEVAVLESNWNVSVVHHFWFYG